MELVTSRIDNGTLFLCLNGHIDSGNAAQAEELVQQLRQEHPTEPVVLDAEQLEYISSAGLRIILRLRKSVPDLRIINVSPSIYEVLDMTGFTEMMPVEKAYRRLSVDGCEIIGRGANGSVYRYDAETIIKVYHNPNALPEIRQERELARKAFIHGINTAIPYDVVRVGDCYGTMFELLNADSISHLIAVHPEELDNYVARFVQLLTKIHSTELTPGEIPDMKAVALDWADFLQDYLPAELWSKLHNLVAAVPERNTMLHGDYHSNNVMVQNGETLLIDMDTLCMGHPIFELASMFNGFKGFSELDPSISMSFLGLSHETSVQIWETSLRMYLDTEDEAVLRSVEEKAMVIGYARLLRRLIRRNGFDTPEGREHIAWYQKRLEQLLPRVDSLDF